MKGSRPRGRTPRTDRARWMRVGLALAIVLLGGTRWAITLADPPAAAVRTLASAHPLSPAAGGKIDPRLLAALALNPARPTTQAGTAGPAVQAMGSGEGPAFPVLVRATLTDAELVALGAQVHSRVGDLVTATVAAQDLDRLAGHPDVHAVEAPYRLVPTLDASIPDIRADLVHAAPGGYTGRGVIVGVVDTGIDYTHEDFQDAQGNTRILALWDQTTAVSAPPSGFTYGREYSRQQIDSGLVLHVDSEGHGSHVAGIAAGDGSSLAEETYRGVAPEADLIVVRNYGDDIFYYGGGATPYGTSATTVGTIDALTYLLQKAQALGRPLVVNLSQGTSMGPHDGTTLFEAAVDELVRSQGLILCVAAGNDQARSWHGRIQVGSAPGRFAIEHDGSQQRESVILFECWYEAGDLFSWEIESPGAARVAIGSNVSPAGGLALGLAALPDSVCYWTTPSHPVNGQGYGYFCLLNRPNGVTAGTWTVYAHPENALPQGGAVDLYCERNQYGLRVVEGVTTISNVGMPGSATEAISVASYNTKLQWQGQDGWHTIAQLGVSENPLGAISTFSAQGPRRDGVRKPDLAAPGQIIASAKAKGYRTDPGFNDPDGRHTYLLGTSMASPHVAGTIALMLEKDPTLGPAEVKSILQQAARQDTYTGPVPNDIFGSGKLDAKAAVDAVEGQVECATRPGDANGDDVVDVFDLVATVNDIIARTPLARAAQACADVNGDRALNVQDLTLIAGLILGTGTGDGAPSLAGDIHLRTPAASSEAPGAPGKLAWNERFDEDAYHLELSGVPIGGLEMAFMLPRGMMVAGSPRVVGLDGGEVRLAHHERLGQHFLVAYAPAGVLADSDDVLHLEVPLRRVWSDPHGPQPFDVTRLIVSDPRGRALRLAGAPSLPADPPPETSGVAAYVARAWPNPARGPMTLRYELPQSGPVRIDVHDVTGRIVCTLWDGWQMAGGHLLKWDARDHHGRAVPAGTYFARLQTAGGEHSRKITITR